MEITATIVLVVLGSSALLGLWVLYSRNMLHTGSSDSTDGHHNTAQNRPGKSTRSQTRHGSKNKIVELNCFTFNTADVIGQGEEGKVYRGTFGESVNAAVKEYRNINMSTKARRKERAVKANEKLLYFSCPNIVRYYSFDENKFAFYLCMELCDCNLEYFIRHRPQEVPKDGFRQMLNGLKGLHDNNFLHRDLKPSNVLVKREHTSLLFKLSDFCLAKETDASNSVISGHYVGTEGWMSPEMHQGVEANTPNMIVKSSADIFACGLLGYYVVSGGNKCYNSQQDINHDIADYSHLVDPTAEDLVRAMTCHDESKRPDVEMCLKHPFHWDSCKTLGYFKVVSDTMIGEQRQGMTNMSNALDQHFNRVFQQDWETILSSQVKIELFLAPRTKNRPMYNKYKVSSLIRAVRNTKDHFHEMSHLHQEIGNNETELLAYWTGLFPQLLIHTYTALKPMAHSYGDLQTYY